MRFSRPYSHSNIYTYLQSADSNSAVINVVVPIHTSNQGPESDYVKQYDSLASPANFPSKTSFLMLMTCARIKITLASEKAPLRRDAGTNVDHLWRNFYRYMARAIADLNVDITARLPVRNLLYRIVDLLSVEVSVFFPCRNHCSRPRP